MYRYWGDDQNWFENLLVKNIPGSQQSKFPGVFITGKLKLRGLFITEKPFLTPGSHFAHHYEHAITFTGTDIHKSDRESL
jgi:hypothetical protein